MNEYDVIIIGAGPAGLTSALYLGRANKKVLLLDKGAPGGKLLTIPQIDNYPGYPSISGLSLANSFLSSASSFGVNVAYGSVNEVKKDDDSFLVATDIEAYKSKCVIVATGLDNVASIPGEKKFLHKGVSYCATCDGRFYKGKRMAVIGNGSKALSEATYLSSLTDEIYLFSDDKDPDMKIDSKIKVVKGAKIKRIEGTDFVEALVYELNDEETTLPLSAVFPLLHEEASSSFLSSLPLEIKGGFIVADEEMRTNVEGLFAIGDVRQKKLRQVVTAASDGAIASASAIAYLGKYGKR